jgi:hypothetical protein
MEPSEAAPGCELPHQRTWSSDAYDALVHCAAERDLADVPARQPSLCRLDDDVFLEAGWLHADLGARAVEQQPEASVLAVAEVEAVKSIFWTSKSIFCPS